MAASPPQSDAQLTLLPPPPPPPESDSQISSLLYEISQQVQAEMEDMLKSIREIDENSAQINEEIDKCKDSALEKKRGLDETKEQVEKAAYAVLQMLNNRA
ncbi:hypothetical protein RchiOBHm_Chr1g0325561 [Rosa chinensis]|uniref:Uncharacterized protein n=1 Tax=Rosa chinensis TaxID=74649 RepID=A0A2P6SA23_ROSCH|nr:putative mediator of RNA polymerase II transcription subunit 21 [Rosa chinensis]PRQ55527.1 hypothetical protein RchiOBHm_Chr1g0325561 [Rosa chinensis]